MEKWKNEQQVQFPLGRGPRREKSFASHKCDIISDLIASYFTLTVTDWVFGPAQSYQRTSVRRTIKLEADHWTLDVPILDLRYRDIYDRMEPPNSPIFTIG